MELTLHNKQELFRLLYGLLYLKVKTNFDMNRYASRDQFTTEDILSLKNECGTSACSAGHGPLFCKTKLPEVELYETIVGTWCKYIENAFGISSAWNSGQFNFLFASDWLDSKTQAAARIYRFLSRGVPGSYNKTSSIYRVPTRQQILALGRELKVPIKSIKVKK